MLQADSTTSTAERNHPLAIRMAAIAFINFNMPIACIYGSFSVLLAAVQTHLHVSQELGSLGIPAVSLVCALTAPIAGALAARFSLRLIMLLGSLLTVAGFVLLAVSASYPLYLIAFGLLIGPGMAVGVVLPGTLVTRWFAVNRGKALGVMTTAIVIVITPQLATWMLHAHGLPATYAMLAAMAAISTVSNLFIIDHPPGAAVSAADVTQAHAPAAGMSMPQLMRSPRFWGLTSAFIASAVSSIVLSVHMVPMAHSFGMSATQGATLLSAMSLAGIAGTNVFGWLADKLGAAVAVTLVVLDSGLLWLLLLLHPAFPEAALLIGLIGLNAAGITPAFSAALSEVFGKESFSQAYGLCQLIILPFSVACVPVVSIAYTKTGSYAVAIIGVAAFLIITALPAISSRRRGAAPALAE
jgi:MFS family permease